MGKYAALLEDDAPPPTRKPGKYAALLEEDPPAAPEVDKPVGPGASGAWEDTGSPIFPTASKIQGKELGPSLKRIGSGVVDLVNMPTRMAATLRGQDMSDPNAAFFRPETEKAVEASKAALKARPDMKDFIPPGGFGGMPMMMPTPSMAPGLTEMGGQMLSDPTLFAGRIAKTAGQVAKAGGRAVLGALPRLKNYVSGLSRIDAPLLEKAATPAGMARLKEGAAANPEDLAQNIATDAGKVNQSREELAANSKALQKGQIQEIDDRNALENQTINARRAAEAEQENARRSLEHQQVTAQVKEEAEGRTLYQQELAANSKRTQQQQTEGLILEARNKATGAPAATLSDLKPGALGEDIKGTVMGSKADMQDTWVKADQASVGPLRSAPAPDVPVGRGKETMKMLTKRLGGVLDKYKAYDPAEGMRRISEGGASAIRDLMGHAEQSGHTVDDLLNIKAELRRARNLDKYKGIPFDLSVDEVAFGDADREIADVIDVALKKAAPKDAGAISELMKAKDRQYAISKDLLGDQARSMGQTQNSANIIQKVRAMGPEKARELIAGAESNPAIASLVPKLRQAFVDDLILSSMKDGEFSAGAMSKLWTSPGMQEMKTAWLAADDLKRIDDALSLGTAEMGRPAAMRPPRIPAPSRAEAQFVPMPPRLGSASDRADGFYNKLAREEIGQPPKIGTPFSYNGMPDKITAESRVKNIGNDTEINKRALEDLRVLDKLNGTNYAEESLKIFEAGQLGMDAKGTLGQSPMQSTGRAGLAAQKGKIVGGIAGGMIGILFDHGIGAAGGGGAAGAVIGDVIANMHANLGSPAGAVAAYRKMNAIAEIRFPRSAAVVRTLEKTTDPAVRARLLATLQTELAKDEEAAKEKPPSSSKQLGPMPRLGQQNERLR